MNNVLGGQYSPVNNVQGDSIHPRMMSGGTILGGGHWVQRTLVIWGSVGDLVTQGFCSIHNLRRHIRTNCMCKSKNMFMYK